MKKYILLMTFLLSVITCFAKITVVISAPKYDDPGFSVLEKTANAYMKAHPDIQIRFDSIPKSQAQFSKYYMDIKNNKKKHIDIFIFNVEQLGIVKPQLQDLSFLKDTPYLKQFIPKFIDINTINNKLLCLPLTEGSGVLFYRKDLLDKYHLSPPKTWSDMAYDVIYIKQHELSNRGKLQGFIFQGKEGEGLTVNALEWINSNKGGTIIDSNQNITINNHYAIDALNMAHAWIGTISPKAVLTFDSFDCINYFKAGNAIFMRNWPYAYVLSLKNGTLSPSQIGVTVLPTGRSLTHGAISGGFLIGINKKAKNQAILLDLVKNLSSFSVQKERAIHYGNTPTISAVYYDKDVLKANPFLKTLAPYLMNDSIFRPIIQTGSAYDIVSQLFYQKIWDVLKGNITAKEAVETISNNIHDITGDLEMNTVFKKPKKPISL